MKKLLSTVSLMALISAPSFASQPSLDDILSNVTAKVDHNKKLQQEHDENLEQYKKSQARVAFLLKNKYLESVLEPAKAATEPHYLDLEGDFATLSLQEKVEQLQSKIDTLGEDRTKLTSIIAKSKELAEGAQTETKEETSIGSVGTPPQDSSKEEEKKQDLLSGAIDKNIVYSVCTNESHTVSKRKRKTKHFITNHYETVTIKWEQEFIEQIGYKLSEASTRDYKSPFSFDVSEGRGVVCPIKRHGDRQNTFGPKSFELGNLFKTLQAELKKEHEK